MLTSRTVQEGRTYAAQEEFVRATRIRSTHMHTHTHTHTHKKTQSTELQQEQKHTHVPNQKHMCTHPHPHPQTQIHVHVFLVLLTQKKVQCSCFSESTTNLVNEHTSAKAVVITRNDQIAFHTTVLLVEMPRVDGSHELVLVRMKEERWRDASARILYWLHLAANERVTKRSHMQKQRE
jgi:hypothetical protein